MKPGKCNLICPQGSTFAPVFTYKIDGTPVDLTGYLARMQVRETHKSVAVLVSVDMDVNNEGGIMPYISAEATAMFKPGKYVYDLELVSPDETVIRLIEGEFIVTPEVTK